MRKEYSEPEFELFRFEFDAIMDGDDPFQKLTPSNPQGYGEGEGEGVD